MHDSVNTDITYEREDMHYKAFIIWLEFLRAVKSGKHKEIAQMIIASDKLLENTLEMDEEAIFYW